MPTPSMEGTILVGDHILVDKLLYGPNLPGTDLRLPALRDVRRGDIVSVRDPLQLDVVLVKRVVAVAGDQIEIRNGVVFVNSAVQPEPYARYSAPARQRSLSLLTVPSGHLFVLGDNRDQSEDSRTFGPLPATNVIGEPVLICWSLANSWQQWLDDHGRVRWASYVSALRHLRAMTRWSRTGKLL